MVTSGAAHLSAVAFETCRTMDNLRHLDMFLLLEKHFLHYVLEILWVSLFGLILPVESKLAAAHLFLLNHLIQCGHPQVWMRTGLKIVMVPSVGLSSYHLFVPTYLFFCWTQIFSQFQTILYDCHLILTNKSYNYRFVINDYVLLTTTIIWI